LNSTKKHFDRRYRRKQHDRHKDELVEWIRVHNERGIASNDLEIDFTFRDAYVNLVPCLRQTRVEVTEMGNARNIDGLSSAPMSRSFG
jgi:hypothetical protein